MIRTRRSKRKFAMIFPINTTYTQTKVGNEENNPKTKTIGILSTNDFNPDKLLELCVWRIPANNWYRILPNNYFRMAQLAIYCWSTMGYNIPPLHKVRVYFYYGKEFRLNQSKFSSLQHVIPGINKFHICFHHPIGEFRQYIFMLANHLIVDQRNG